MQIPPKADLGYMPKSAFGGICLPGLYD